MKGKTKRKFTADFKLKVVLEVLKEKDTLAVISKQFLETAPTLFEYAHKVTPATEETDLALLYEQIGRLQMDVTFFKKKLPL